MQKVIEAAPVEFDRRELDHFSATFAKWRFQTIPLAQFDLLRLRVPSQYIREEFFADSQDTTLIKKVVAAAADHEFWAFLSSSYEFVFSPCEEKRCWGLKCTCPQHVQDRLDGVKHIDCVMNSRRLREVVPTLADERRETKQKQRDLTPANTEGSNLVCILIKEMLARKVGALDTRFGYFKKLPWYFAHADEIDGAQEVMRQVRARPLEDHDSLTQMIMRRVGGDIERRAHGEEASLVLIEEVKRTNDSPLNESLGEGLWDSHCAPSKLLVAAFFVFENYYCFSHACKQ